ncbi:hypothetical protein BFJ63_vAg6347 [Fusarium oxysporum f. sp. narcissi]|uniref:Uncharacterized protein n=2 Tax=Fusarium oxysporum TaxID=5507 RepID=A0A4Q2VV41_FUSOX|nr:hypothetical protein FOWG_03708 [Fusarium oxysporum f. sp. lycopersici MN25]KAJ4140736.1 hypothetical protein NW765_016231 [Fusarium oxysporum]RKK12889.1 hypothetical protein BFJ65_g12145 [Fusarium oxysporum f. sp. cepae]RYC90730.1 hypothetical protein BFJ63_vAg6347 [Fusarium oxysporum f. sp. narcissi]KAJ4277717.1 hypothetical protein NW764_007756 [Fusarium oxysporum]
MADSSPKTPAETPTNDQQGLRRSSRSNRGQLSQNHFLLQHYVVGEEAARPIHGPGRRRAIAKPEADDDDVPGPLAQSAPTASSNTRRPRMQSPSNNFANFGSHEKTPAGSTGAVALIGDRRRSASPPQFASSNMRDRQDPAPQQQTMPAFPWEPAFQYGSQLSPQYQSLGQQKIPSLIMSVQPGQMAPHQHFEPQTQESVSDAPEVFVNPEDLMLDTQDLVNPQTNNILKSEIPQFAELVDSYNKLHKERRVQEVRDRLAAQEETDKAKAAEAEEMSQEEMDALWDQFMNPDAFK